MLDFFGDHQPSEQAVALAMYLGEIAKDPSIGTEVEEMVTENLPGAVERLIEACAVLLTLSETDMASSFNTIVFLLRSAKPDATDTLITKLCTVLSSTKEKATGRLKALLFLYNNLPPNSPYSFTVYLALAKVAGATMHFGALMAQPTKLDTLMVQWQLQPAQKQQLYRTLYEAATASENSGLARDYLVLYLRSYNKCNGVALATVKQEAKQCILDFISSPTLYQLEDLLELDAVLQLKDTPVYQLLLVFIQGDLKDWKAFQTDVPDCAEQWGLNLDQCLMKMRVLTLSALASKMRQVPYTAIVQQLEVNEDEVERWIIETVRAGLVQGRMDQAGRHLIVRKASGRTYTQHEWETVLGRLSTWSSTLATVQERLHSLRLQPTLGPYQPHRLPVTHQ